MVTEQQDIKSISKLIIDGRWPFPPNLNIPEFLEAEQYRKFKLDLESKKAQLNARKYRRQIKIRKKK